MLIKQVQFRGLSESGEVFCQPLHVGGMQKTAQVLAMRSKLHPRVQDFVNAVRPSSSGIYVLVNALGAGEFWGANVNGDFFPEKGLIHAPPNWEELLASPDQARQVGSLWQFGYPTFMGAFPYKHHVNKDPSRAFGRVELATWNPVMHRVELVVYLDRALCMQFDALDIIERIEHGEFPDVSMGCKVPYDVCMICQHKSKTRADYCQHALMMMNKILPDGRKVCVSNDFPKFFDISFVFIGADKTAKVMAKLAQEGNRVCMGDFCSIPRLSADVGNVFSKQADPVDELISNFGYNKQKALEDKLRDEKIRSLGLSTEEIAKTASAKLKHIALGSILGALALGPINGLMAKHIRKKEGYDTTPEQLKPHVLRGMAGGAILGGLGVHYGNKLGDYLVSKVASPCACDCAGEDCLSNIFPNANEKAASHAKVSEIIKAIPAGPFSKETLPKLEAAEKDIPNHVLEEMAQLPLGSALSTLSMMGVVLRPREFQRLILIHIGERPLADQMDQSNTTFARNGEVDESIPLGEDQVNPNLMATLRNQGIVEGRSAAGPALLRRTMAVKNTNTPTTSAGSLNKSSDPLMNKLAAAYNGYRLSMIKKAASISNFMTTNSQLQSDIFGSGMAKAFAGGVDKVASTSVMTPDSLAYLVGAYNDRDMSMTDVVVASLAQTGAVRETA